MLSHHSDLVSQSLFNMSSKFSVQKYVNMWYAPHRCEWSSLKQVESNDEILSIAGMHTCKNLYCIRGAAETQKTSRGSNFSSLCILSHTFVAVGSLNHNPSGLGCGLQQTILWMSHVVYCYPSAVLHISFQN